VQSRAFGCYFATIHDQTDCARASPSCGNNQTRWTGKGGFASETSPLWLSLLDFPNRSFWPNGRRKRAPKLASDQDIMFAILAQSMVSEGERGSRQSHAHALPALGDCGNSRAQRAPSVWDLRASGLSRVHRTLSDTGVLTRKEALQSLYPSSDERIGSATTWLPCVA